MHNTIINKPLVSVVIPVYNGSNYLKDAIDSVLLQTYKNIELIIVNDGSTDGGATRDLANSYGEKIRYFEKDNGGTASALNYGIRKMKGQYFVWLSHDDTMHPDRIMKQLERMRENNVRVAICSGFYTDGKREQILKASQEDEYEIYAGIAKIVFGSISFAGVMMERSIFTCYGLFDEKLSTTQDVEYLFRICKEKTVYMNEALFTYRIHDEQGTKTNHMYAKNADSMLYYMLQNISDEDMESVFGSKETFAYRLLVKSILRRNKSATYCLDLLASVEFKTYKIENSGRLNNVWIFGAGIRGKRLLFDLRCRGIIVKGFLDNDADKWGKMIDGIVCKGLQEYDEGLIIISANPAYEDEIARDIESYGIKEYWTHGKYDDVFQRTVPAYLDIMKTVSLYRNENWIEIGDFCK